MSSSRQSLCHWSMQANSSEMMRLGTILLTRAGLRICMIVHDAYLVESPISEIYAAAAKTQECMEKASRIILNGHALRSDAQIFRYPERFPESNGLDTWELFQKFLADNPSPSLYAPQIAV